MGFAPGQDKTARRWFEDKRGRRRSPTRRSVCRCRQADCEPARDTPAPPPRRPRRHSRECTRRGGRRRGPSTRSVVPGSAGVLETLLRRRSTSSGKRCRARWPAAANRTQALAIKPSITAANPGETEGILELVTMDLSLRSLFPAGGGQRPSFQPQTAPKVSSRPAFPGPILTARTTGTGQIAKSSDLRHSSNRAEPAKHRPTGSRAAQRAGTFFLSERSGPTLDCRERECSYSPRGGVFGR